MRELVLDVETTGLNYKDHRIIEIGIIELFDKIATGNVFHYYINPERSIDKEAEAVHGISFTFLQDKCKFYEIVSEIIEFIGSSPIIAHNINFDMSFLNEEIKRCNKPMLTNKQIDTLDLARRKFGQNRNSLDDLCKKFNISISDRKYHGALKDANLLSLVYYFICIEDGLLNYEEFSFNEQYVICKRDFSSYISEEEIIRHQEMML